MHASKDVQPPDSKFQPAAERPAGECVVIERSKFTFNIPRAPFRTIKETLIYSNLMDCM